MQHEMQHKEKRCRINRHLTMLDDSTIIRNVKRILPGHMVVIRDGIVENRQYYNMNHIETQEMSEEEAIERLDKAFRNAIRREFEKDIEYGYRHLVYLVGIPHIMGNPTYHTTIHTTSLQV